MGPESALYKIVLLLHILTVIVGFGGVVTHGFYNAKAFRDPARRAGDVLTTTRGVTNYAHYAIYAVLPLGIVLVAVSDKTYEFSQAWISASFVVWILLVGAAHGLVRPAVAKLGERAAAIGPDTVLDTDGEAVAASKKLMLGESATQLLLVIAIVLMVFKPGA